MGSICSSDSQNLAENDNPFQSLQYLSNLQYHFNFFHRNTCTPCHFFEKENFVLEVCTGHRTVTDYTKKNDIPIRDGANVTNSGEKPVLLSSAE